jgi:hypothetical protein
VEEIDISCSEIGMAMVYAGATKPDRIDKVDGASIRQLCFHSASVHGVRFHRRRTVHHLPGFHIVDELGMGKTSTSVGISEMKWGRYAIPCFSQISSFRISYVVKGVDSVTMKYEKLLFISTNKMTSAGLSPMSLNFSSKIEPSSWVVAFMMVRVTVALFKLRPQRKGDIEEVKGTALTYIY